MDRFQGTKYSQNENRNLDPQFIVPIADGVAHKLGKQIMFAYLEDTVKCNYLAV